MIVLVRLSVLARGIIEPKGRYVEAYARYPIAQGAYAIYASPITYRPG